MNKDILTDKFDEAMNEKRLLPEPTSLPSYKEERARAVPLVKLVEKFITGPVKKEILATKMTYNQKKNVLEGRCSTKELPSNHYAIAKDFDPLFVKMMADEGYKACITHDGGGMYSLAFITWTVELDE
jgi:hypothetical protein